MQHQQQLPPPQAQAYLQSQHPQSQQHVVPPQQPRHVSQSAHLQQQVYLAPHASQQLQLAQKVQQLQQPPQVQGMPVQAQQQDSVWGAQKAMLPAKDRYLPTQQYAHTALLHATRLQEPMDAHSAASPAMAPAAGTWRPVSQPGTMAIVDAAAHGVDAARGLPSAVLDWQPPQPADVQYGAMQPRGAFPWPGMEDRGAISDAARFMPQGVIGAVGHPPAQPGMLGLAGRSASPTASGNVPNSLLDMNEADDALFRRKSRATLRGMSEEELTAYKREQNRVRARRARVRRKKVENTLVERTVHLSIYEAMLSHAPIVFAALTVLYNADWRFDRISSNWNEVGQISQSHLLVDNQMNFSQIVHPAHMFNINMRDLTDQIQTPGAQVRRDLPILSNMGMNPTNGTYVTLRCQFKYAHVSHGADSAYIFMYAEPWSR